MARRPKVFCWSDGLRTFTVATPSRAKALEAWGVERDLFKNGGAREVEGGLDYEAALDQPGKVLERRLEVEVAPTAPRTKSAAKRGKPQAKAVVRASPSGPSRADLARVARLEKALAAFDKRQAHEARAAEARVGEAEQALDAARSAERRLRTERRRARAELEAELDEARASVR